VCEVFQLFSSIHYCSTLGNVLVTEFYFIYFWISGLTKTGLIRFRKILNLKLFDYKLIFKRSICFYTLLKQQ